MARPPVPPPPDPDTELLTPAEVGRIFRVDPKTVTRWAKAGRFPDGAVIRTMGGHRRYRADYIRERLSGGAR